MQNNKIFQISFGDGYAGSARMALLASCILAHRGYDVTFFVTTDSLTERRAKEKGLKYISIDSRKPYKQVFSQIKEQFIQQQPDFVIGYHSLDRKIGITLKRLFRKKFMNIAYRQNMSESLPVIGSIIYNLYCDYQIACSEGVAKSLRSSGIRKKKIKVIHNISEIPDDVDHYSGKLIREKYNIEDKIVLGVSSWFHKHRKGFDILFTQFKKLDDKYVLLIFGIPESGREEVNDYAAGLGADKSRIIMPGYVDNIWEYYKASDIFLLPSRSEGFSLALLEAAASRLPIVASDIPGNNEFIENGVNGLLFKMDYPDGLSEAILKFADNDFASRLSNAAYQKVMTNYRLPHLGEKLDKFLQEISHK